MRKNWSRTYWEDLLERVGATAIGALLTALTGNWSGVLPHDARAWWLVIGLPTLVSLLKGLAANMADPTSGPSLLPSPPAPEIDEATQGQDGAADYLVLIAVLALFVATLAICGVRLG